MLHLLLLAYILAVSAVGTELEMPNEIRPEETGRFINKDDLKHFYELKIAQKEDNSDKQQNKVVADVFRPNYDQPTWVFDYRNLKTGSQDMRDLRGQALILPNNIRNDEHKEFLDYGSILEHLRFKNIAENVPFQQPAEIYDWKKYMTNY